MKTQLKSRSHTPLGNSLYQAIDHIMKESITKNARNEYVRTDKIILLTPNRQIDHSYFNSLQVELLKRIYNMIEHIHNYLVTSIDPQLVK